MASIIARKRADGTIVYKAMIVISKDGKIAHRESKTFLKQRLAKDWALRREVELQETDVYKRKAFLSIGDVIRQYLIKFPPDGRTKKSALAALIKEPISSLNVHTLSEKDIIEHISERNKQCLPQTAHNDLIWLRTAIKSMKSALGLELDIGIFDEASVTLKREGLIAKSAERDRLPTKQELIALSRHFHGHWMLHIMWFAIYSARRQSEITRIEWDDLDPADKTCMVRDLKDPLKRKIKRRFKLPNSAYKIICRQPRTNRRIFPYNSKTVGKYFSNACHLLEIEDLHFHDLRHAATTALFMKGLTIQEVQHVTLHANWKTLQRYCNTRPGDVNI